MLTLCRSNSGDIIDFETAESRSKDGTIGKFSGLESATAHTLNVVFHKTKISTMKKLIFLLILAPLILKAQDGNKPIIDVHVHGYTEQTYRPIPGAPAT